MTGVVGAMPLDAPTDTALVDNQETWLAVSDLVFVDPIFKVGNDKRPQTRQQLRPGLPVDRHATGHVRVDHSRNRQRTV